MSKLVVNLTMLSIGLPFLDRFVAAARTGFGAVEFLFPYECEAREIKQHLQENQLQLAPFNTPPGDVNAGEQGLATVPGRSTEACRQIRLALEYARQLDCPWVCIMADVVQPGMNRAACEAVLIDNLRCAAGCFACHGKRILTEALNPQTRSGYLCHSQYQTPEMVKRVGKPNVAVQLDLFHMQKVDDNLSHLITGYAGQYRRIQIVSLPDRHESDEGEINYPWLYALLSKTDYDGWIGCEYTP